ncbi:helix-turn-helix domain-containing protein [Saccharopolyspora shandongensis]|uniref:helix-turn-helix domain-containing protein n=1 Tax=Saccharopolyspora shandongensis TaxID=418495 RepID=UPI0033F1B3CB
MRENVIALDYLWGRDTPRRRERLHHARTWQDRFALIDAELSGRFDEGREVEPEVAWAWRQIVASRGRAEVRDLAAGSGWSRQRLWSRFGSQIGLTAKRAAMVVRVDHAVRLIRGHAPAQVAASGGYTDQSLLNHDVRAFAGTTPAVAVNEPWLAADDTAWPSP